MVLVLDPVLACKIVLTDGNARSVVAVVAVAAACHPSLPLLAYQFVLCWLHRGFVASF
jgi:hypothetical protein